VGALASWPTMTSIVWPARITMPRGERIECMLRQSRTALHPSISSRGECTDSMMMSCKRQISERDR